MNNWLTPKAFLLGFAMMAVPNLGRLVGTDATVPDLASTLFICVIGGVFWGAIGTYVSRRWWKR